MNKYHRLTVGTKPEYGYPFKTVCNCMRTNEGLGFILSNNVVCVDLDHCITEGQLSESARQLVDELQTYTEISVSGTGLHLFYIDENHNNINRKHTFELFSARKYVSVTGNKWEGTPAELSILTGKTKDLLEKYFPSKSNSQTQTQTFSQPY